MNSERGAKLILLPIFMGVAGWVSQNPLNLSVGQFALLTLATIRLGRMIAFEEIFEPLRAPFAKVVKHPYAGSYTDAKYESGWRKSIGSLLTCPTCSSTWAMLLVFVGLNLSPELTWTLVKLLALVSAGEVIGSVIEFLCWGSDAFRKHSG